MLSYSLNSQLHTLSFNSKPTTFLLEILPQPIYQNSAWCWHSSLSSILRCLCAYQTQKYRLTNQNAAKRKNLFTPSSSLCWLRAVSFDWNKQERIKPLGNTIQIVGYCYHHHHHYYYYYYKYYYYKYYYYFYHSDHSISVNPYHNCFGIYYRKTQKPKKLFYFCQ